MSLSGRAISGSRTARRTGVAKALVRRRLLLVGRRRRHRPDPNLFDPVTAHRYRDLILAPGGARDAADLVEDFLGRPYTFDAYGAWLAR